MLPPASSPATATRSGRALRHLAAGALIVLLAACATRTVAPVVERAPLPAPAPAPIAPVPEEAPVAPPAPEPDWRPPAYTVKRGDTLHQIALDHGLDYRELAAWNNIENPNLIRVGQVLLLGVPGAPGATAAGPGVTVTPLLPAPVIAGDARAPGPVVPRNADNYKTQPKAVKEPYSEQALREVQRAAGAAPPPAAAAPAAAAPGAATATPAPAAVARAEAKPEPRGDAKSAPPAGGDDKDRIEWLWPATGKLVTGFSDSANLKGIDIAGKAGQPVLASAAGKVVYAGSGLRGYGKLVIVKHNDTFLSAYAHNSGILVKEGQQVTRGQKIAEMGSTDSDQVKLHFEIRRLGKPVDPLKYLPPA